MKVTVFDTKPYDRQYFDAENKNYESTSRASSIPIWSRCYGLRPYAAPNGYCRAKRGNTPFLHIIRRHSKRIQCIRGDYLL